MLLLSLPELEVARRGEVPRRGEEREEPRGRAEAEAREAQPVRHGLALGGRRQLHHVRRTEKRVGAPDLRTGEVLADAERVVAEGRERGVVEARVAPRPDRRERRVVRRVRLQERLEAVEDGAGVRHREAGVDHLVMARLLDDDVAGVQFQEVVAGGEIVDERAHEGAAAHVRLRGVLERRERQVVEGLVDLGGLVAQLEAGERPELERLGRRDAGVEAREA